MSMKLGDVEAQVIIWDHGVTFHIRNYAIEALAQVTDHDSCQFRYAEQRAFRVRICPMFHAKCGYSCVKTNSHLCEQAVNTV